MGKNCKLDDLFLKILLYSWPQIRQSEYIVMKTKEESTTLVNLMTPWAGDIVVGRGHVSNKEKMNHFFSSPENTM